MKWACWSTAPTSWAQTRLWSNRGGGNTSVMRRVVDFRGREVDTLTVKGTGADLRTITAKGFADVVIDDMMPLLAVATCDACAPGPISDERRWTEYLSHCVGGALITRGSAPGPQRQPSSLLEMAPTGCAIS